MVRFPRSLSAALVLALLSLPTLVMAQQKSVIVLGIRSVEGDDDIANNLTGALRNAASNVPDWNVAEAEVSLAQMSMAHGCDEPDAACMAEISSELGQERTIYGTVRRTGAGAEYDFALTLYFFNAESSQIEDSLTDTIPRIHQDIDNLRTRSARYIAQFAGQAQYGSVRVHVNQAGAQVTLDGEEVGVTDAEGVLLIEDVTEGQHDVRVSAVDFEPFQGSVRVVADELTDFRGNLTASEGPNLAWIPGAAMIVVGGALAAVGISNWSTVRDYESQASPVESLSRDEGIAIREQATMTNTQPEFSDGTRFTRWQAMRLLGSGNDVCSASGRTSQGTAIVGSDEWDRECDAVNKAHRRQFIFNFLGLAIGGTGIALLIVALTGGGDDDGDAEARRFQLTPAVGRRAGGFQAALQF